MGFFYSYQGLGKAWLNLHKPKLALQYLEKAKTVSDQVKSSEMNVTLDQAFYQYYKETGDYAKAMVIMETLQHTRDSVHQKLREQDFTDLRTVYEKELSVRENKVLKAQHAEDLATIGLKERTEKFYLVFAFLLLSILAVLFFYYKQRRVLLKRAEQANAKLQMQNKQLEEQERSLNELNKTKDKIFSVLGHDLRAPLTSVLGCIQVLKYDEISSEEKERVVGLLENEVDLTLKSLEDILLWSRIQMDKSISEKKAIDLFKLLKEITQLYKPLASRKEVEIILEAEENQILLGDPHQVKSIMANLVSNAIKFSPEKNAVTITLKDRDGQIEIRVNDNGTGIDPEIIENLNNPKRKLSTAGTKGEVGMGVGLSLIKEFIDANEGSLEFEKGFPTGTSAIVRFPGVQSMITSLAF